MQTTLDSCVKLKQEEKAERTAELGFYVPPAALLQFHNL